MILQVKNSTCDIVWMVKASFWGLFLYVRNHRKLLYIFMWLLDKRTLVISSAFCFRLRHCLRSLPWRDVESHHSQHALCTLDHVGFYQRSVARDVGRRFIFLSVLSGMDYKCPCVLVLIYIDARLSPKDYTHCSSAITAKSVQLFQSYFFLWNQTFPKLALLALHGKFESSLSGWNLSDFSAMKIVGPTFSFQRSVQTSCYRI